MKCNHTIFLIVSFFCILVACKKDDSKQAYGFSRIYMPQALLKSGGVDNSYPVPSGSDSSTYNYLVNQDSGKINVILGASLSGPASDAYSVNIAADNDTVQQMLKRNLLDTALYRLMPSDMYTLPPRLNVAAGKRSGTFYLSVDIAHLKQTAYTGKYLVLAVKLSSPSQYQLDSAHRTTVIMLNVDALVIGPAVNITSQYILNPGNPFIAVAMNGTRWGTLKDWKTSPSVLSHGGVGGFSSDGDGKTMDMESGWGSPQILNGKIYQTITLPKGTYAFDASGGNWKWQGTKDAGYMVVAPGAAELPDYSNIVNNASVLYQKIAQPQTPVIFQLNGTTAVTLGIVVNYIQDQQGIKTTQVNLFNYPRHL